jgi:hypothetical protein
LSKILLTTHHDIAQGVDAKVYSCGATGVDTRGNEQDADWYSVEFAPEGSCPPWGANGDDPEPTRDMIEQWYYEGGRAQ